MAPVDGTSEADRYRLPRSVVPSRYLITLAPDLQTATFTGTVCIEVEVRETVSRIVINAAELEFQRAWMERDAERIDLQARFDRQTERCMLESGSPIPPGASRIHIAFTGVLNDKLRGFYLSTFTDEQGVQRRIATTQMEAPHARRAFPCWDEPDFKASFAITMVVPEELTALSNGAQESVTGTGDGRKTVVFAETMKMSTYLVAFIVGPLGVTPPVDVNGTPLRVAYPPAKQGLTGYALECGRFALGYFGDYYGIAYPGGKLDLVAVPDFAFGAMENLGCVTFRETALLVDPARATQPDLQRVADVIHHEIAHMWFGDLVTMRWWNGIWLNEAFATFMEMKCTDAFRPQWKRWVDFGLSRTAAFDVDALESTRPVEYRVVSPEDAEGMFDILTYEKGAAVLLMLEQYLGEEPFMNGVRKYLSDHSYGNTETTDLWDCMEAATGQPVRTIMDTWIFQGGYPILSVELRKAKLTLRQRRFSYREGDVEPLWKVPVIIRYGSGDQVRTEKLLLQTRVSTFDLDLSPDWLVINSDAAGFFRVLYPPDLLDSIHLMTREGVLSPLERYQLLDDSFAAVLAGFSTASQFLELAETFAADTDLSVWTRLAGALGSLDRIVDDAGRPRFQAMVRALARPALDRLGYDARIGDTEREKQLRGTLLEVMGSLGKDVTVRRMARHLHDRFVADPDLVDPALAAAAIAIVADHGTEEDFNLFWRRHQGAQSPQLANRYLFALARFTDLALIDRMLHLAITEVRTQDAPLLLQRGLANRQTGPRVFGFVTANWETITGRFPNNLLVKMADGVRTFTDAGLAEEVVAFFAQHPLKQGERTLAQHLEKMQVNVALKQREQGRFPPTGGSV